ncbi:MAG: polysaccharide deacetylase family protein [Pseudomonadota bacterium]
MTKPLASLSLDLDNLWSYQKTHGNPEWEALGSYFGTVVPRILDALDEADLRMTVFVVGQDAALPKNGPALRSIAEAGHEIGNHSFRHEPWLHLYTPVEVIDEIARAEEAIEAATGVRPRGFRGPGYSLSETVLNVLASRGYAYDCSTFPTYIGPLARAYYFFNATLSREERKKRGALFGNMRDGLRPLAPYRWDLGERELIEVPLSTVPVARIPFHFSYLHWLAEFSETLAEAYFRTALRMCRVAELEPSLLLHPLDFVGGDDVESLAFFPGMKRPAEVKLRRMDRWLGMLAKRFEVLAMGAYVAEIAERDLPFRTPDLEKSGAALDPNGFETESRL